MPSQKYVSIKDISKLSAQELIDKIEEVCKDNNIDLCDTELDLDSDYDELSIFSKSEYWPDEI